MLVVFQFTLSTLLIIASIMIFRQLDYLQNRDPGFATDNVVYMMLSGDSREKYMVLKNALLKNPDVEYVSRSNSLPFYQGSNSGGFDWEGRSEDEDFLIGFGFFDFDCDKALGLRMKEGRFFDQDFATDSSQAVIINEKAVELTGMEEAVGSWMSWGDNRYYVVGVVEDFHHLPLQYEIDPYAMFLVSSYSRYVFIKLNETGEEQLAFLESAWNEVYPDYPYRYTMLKETYTRVYRDEAKLSRLIRYFAFLAIFITCLGLLGLAAFTAEQRTREIGIRKAFGAGVSQLYILVSKEFIWWVLLANILAWPLAWWVLDRWLSSFAYHTSISWWIFVLSALIGLFIALLTVSYQVWKVTRSNIIDSLRYE